MQELPAFGKQLVRLAEIRGIGPDTMARRAAVPEAEFTSVLDGAEPSPAFLDRLAPVLGLHRSDLFVIAGQQVPDEISPPYATARWEIAGLAWSLTFIPRAIPDLYELVRSLPRLPRPAGPVEPPPPHHSYPPTPGGLVLRLLHNRNLDWQGAAYFLCGLGNGPMLSASTIGIIGQGRKTLTPDLLAGLGAVLDITSADLTALTGVDPTDADANVHPEAAQAAALIWSARTLAPEQLRQVRDRAHTLRCERAEELDPRHRCHCTER